MKKGPAKRARRPAKAPDLSYIAEPLRPLAVLVSSLRPDRDNRRLHSEKNVSTVEASLRRFGQRKPVVVQKAGRIVRAGNATLLAASRLGWSHVAAVVVEEPDDLARAFAIVDNRSAELATWDGPSLLADLRAFEESGAVELPSLGFDGVDLSALVRAYAPAAPAEFPAVDDDVETSYRCPSCNFEWSGKPKP